MRILTVRQPWAWAIIHAGKDVENRVRNIAGDYRGPVAIHAGLAQFEDDGQYYEVKRAIVSELNGWPAGDAELWSADSIEPDDPRFVYGAIIGIVDLADTHQAKVEYHPNPDTPHIHEWTGRHCCTPWGELGAVHMTLRNARPIVTPIPYRGALGLRTLHDDITHQITTALAANRKDPTDV